MDRLTAEQVGELEAAWKNWHESVACADTWASAGILMAQIMRHGEALLATANREAERAAEIERLTKALRELYSASCEQQFTLNSRGWNKHPDDKSGKNDWAVGGAHRHQFDRVQRAIDAADKALHPEDVEAIARTALGKEERT